MHGLDVVDSQRGASSARVKTRCLEMHSKWRMGWFSPVISQQRTGPLPDVSDALPSQRSQPLGASHSSLPLLENAEPKAVSACSAT